MDTDTIPDLVLRIKEMADIVYAREPQWNVREMTLLPPAAADDVERLSESCPHPLPRSYRRFLSYHDGSLNFWFRFTLLGTKGEARAFVAKEIEDAREFQTEYAAADGGQLTPESIAHFEIESEDAQELFIPNHTVFGANGGGEFLLFNDHVRHGSEYEIVHHTYSGGIYYRYESFEAYLQATLKRAEEHVRDQKYR